MPSIIDDTTPLVTINGHALLPHEAQAVRVAITNWLVALQSARYRTMFGHNLAHLYESRLAGVAARLGIDMANIKAAGPLA